MRRIRFHDLVLAAMWIRYHSAARWRFPRAWYPTCKAQKPIVESLTRRSACRDVEVMSVDLDADNPLLKMLEFAMQRTLIAFTAGKNEDRSVGNTTPARIATSFRKAEDLNVGFPDSESES